jgi:hypothetical protein
MSLCPVFVYFATWRPIDKITIARGVKRPSLRELWDRNLDDIFVKSVSGVMGAIFGFLLGLLFAHWHIGK